MMMRYSGRAQRLRSILGAIRVALIVVAVLLVGGLWFFHDRMSRVTVVVVASVGLLMIVIAGYALQIAFRDMPELEKLAKRADEEEGR
jgi:protein-S-isoprenylcysteine O-methyltransferase Ste14